MKISKKLSFLGVLVALSLSACGGGETPYSSESSSEQESSSQSQSSSESSSSKSSEASTTSSSEGEIVDELPDLGEVAVAIHYHRDDGKYSKWNLWLWPDNGEGKAYEFNYQDDYGVVGLYALSTWTGLTSEGNLNFIVRTDSWDKDPDGDRAIEFSTLQQDEKQTFHVYLCTEDSTIYTDPVAPLQGGIKTAQFINETRVSIVASKPMSKVEVFENGVAIGEKTFEKPNAIAVFELSDFNIDYSKEYTYKATIGDSVVRRGDVDVKNLYGNDSFNQVYAYDGDLGALYTKEATTFKVWSPFSSAIKVRIYDSGTPSTIGGGSDVHEDVDMVKGEKGVFSATVNGDLEGKYYTYVVTNRQFTNKEVVDPYAKSAGVNGLRGMIVDFEKANPTGWGDVDYLGYNRKELVVYETHVADVTSSSTWGGTLANQKLFKGMYEIGTTYTEGSVTVKTGFDHIKELGVNAVQILPLFDQANDEVNMTFNWGYNPLNYNVVEGGYSTNPKDGYTRIREFKELVKAYKEAGIEIIMDVVYNHVNSAEGSNFDVLAPGYYFRYKSTGGLSNGSGCGNETASDHYMFRKFMIDSTEFWIDEYKLDGFRFDLMGLHDIETMNLLTANAKTINPNIVIYGEPWTGGTSELPTSKQAIQANADDFVGYGQFNDQLRNSLHGGVFDDTLKKLGWCDTNASVTKTVFSAITDAMAGITRGGTKDPDKTVNYVSCHDNRTLFDRIAAAVDKNGKAVYNPKTDYEEMVKMIDVAHAVVMLSEGTSFMLAGEEFARTKGGDHNSYQSSYKVNELDYSLKVKNINLFNNMKSYINIKKTQSLLHLAKDQLFLEGDKTGTQNVFFTQDDKYNSMMMVVKYGGKELAVLHRNSGNATKTYDLSGYELLLDSIYGNEKVLSASTTLDKYETIVAIK